MIIANDNLSDFKGTSSYHVYLPENVLTDGVIALAEKFRCYWYLDIICSYSDQLNEHDFQVWTLEKLQDSSAIVTCTDGNDKVLIEQKIQWTDFSVDKAIVWKQFNVLYLPSEH